MFEQEFIEKLKDMIQELLNHKDRVIVAIDGKCGSGKTSLASLLSEIYDCNVFHMDDFFLRPLQRTPERFKEIGGNVDYERFFDEVIQGLESGIPFSYRPLNCMEMALDPELKVFPKKLNIIEGSYSLHPTLSDHYDLKVFLTIDEDVQKLRILNRNGPEKLKRFIDEWIPRENEYFTTMRVMEQCGLVYWNP